MVDEPESAVHMEADEPERHGIGPRSSYKALLLSIAPRSCNFYILFRYMENRVVSRIQDGTTGSNQLQ